MSVRPEELSHAASGGAGPNSPPITSATPTRNLPRAPANPWDATSVQSFAANLRLARALKPKLTRITVRASDLRLVLHDKGISEMSDEVVGYLRKAAKDVLGGNCAFVDDDLAILTHLAMRAVDAGLVDGISPGFAAKATKLAAERKASAEPADGTGGDPSPPQTADEIPGTNP